MSTLSKRRCSFTTRARKWVDTMTPNPAVNLFATSLVVAAAVVMPTQSTLTDIPTASLAEIIQAAVTRALRFAGKLWQD